MSIFTAQNFSVSVRKVFEALASRTNLLLQVLKVGVRERARTIENSLESFKIGFNL